MPKVISKKPKVTIDVDHIASLASLTLSEEEKRTFTGQLEETIEYVKRLEELNTQGIQPTSQVTNLENITRDDIASPSLSQDEALKNAKSTHNGFIMTKAILEEQ